MYFFCFTYVELFLYMAYQTSHLSNQRDEQAHSRSTLYAKTIRRLDVALKCLEKTIYTPNLSNRYRLVTIRDKITRMIRFIQSYNPYDEISIKQFYLSLSRSVSGHDKWSSISR